MTVFRVRWVQVVMSAMLGVASLNMGLSFWVMKRLEKKAGSPIQATFLPDVFYPSFTLKNIHLHWQDRFQVLSGTLHVQYNPLSLFTSRKLRVQIEGSNLTTQLLGEFAESQGISRAEVDRAKIDFALGDQGPPDVFLLEVHSPQLEFQMGEKKRL